MRSPSGAETRSHWSDRLLAGNEAIEALIWMHAALGLPHEIPLEFEGSREVHGIRRRQRVVETAVIGVRSKSFDGLNLVWYGNSKVRSRASEWLSSDSRFQVFLLSLPKIPSLLEKYRFAVLHLS